MVCSLLNSAWERFLNESEPKSKARIALVEMMVAIGIISTMAALILPAVWQGQVRLKLLQQGTWEYWLWENSKYAWVFPFLSAGVFGPICYLLSRLLPSSVTQYFQWQPLPKPPLVETPAPAIASSTLASIGTVVLLVAASHVRVDRRTRRPVVTWEGPLADYILWVDYLGWGLSLGAIACGVLALNGCRSRLNWLGMVGMIVGTLNFLGSCLFGAFVYED